MMCVGLLALKGKLFCTLACAQTYTSVPQTHDLTIRSTLRIHHGRSLYHCRGRYAVSGWTSMYEVDDHARLWLGEYVQGEGRRPRVL